MIIDINKGLDLEKARRAGPFNEKGHSLCYDEADASYMAWLRLNGYLLIKIAKDSMDRGESCPTD